MAEAVAVAGLVAAIIQLADFGTKVVSRLNEFLISLYDVPATFRAIKTEFPLLLDTL
ncbi:hypothetical protein ABVK25_006125 [Lepraria finkii]|uniref:Uncharacterized protein n=1 Tax=Lepraria finkii TaxID=1340010 RepID=A0ABR4B6I0_9LECA